MVGRIKAKFTTDLDKLWSCEIVRKKYPHKIGQKPLFCGKIIEVEQIDTPKNSPICSSSRFCRPVGGDPVILLYNNDLDKTWVCDHLLDVGD